MQVHARSADEIDRIRAQWRSERADLDTSPMETIGRILRIEFLAAVKIRRVLQDHGIDRGGCDVLATLRRSGTPHQMTPTRLYKELVLTSGAMTHRLDALEHAQLVERQPDPEDRRGTLIGLTKKGRAVVDRAMDAHLAGEAAIAAHLSKAEQKVLSKLLKKLLVGMENEDERK
jgi:DNA-binding MarR family transcriptional regulator